MSQTDPSFPALHGRPDQGWVNDPNGLAVIDGRYHVFFQYNPDAPVHRNIHWGHISSTDLVRWHQEPIALVPRTDGPDGMGCWTGCLVDDQGTPTAVYTAAGARYPREGGVALATSDRSAISWTQSQSVLDESNGPDEIEVRDPYVFSFRGRRYAVQGGGSFGGPPRILLYGCDDLQDWTYLGELVQPGDSIAAACGDVRVWECPNLVELDGRWVLLTSPLVAAEKGLASGPVTAFVGRLEPAADGLRFHPETTCQVDGGASFYAPQVLVHGERRLLWAWSRDLGRPAADIEATGWTGTLTFPRELRLVAGTLRAEPAAELIGLRRERLTPEDGVVPANAFEIEGSTTAVRLILERDGAAQTVLDHRRTQPGNLRILVDGSLVEVFVDGEPPQTLRAYPGPRSRWRIEGDTELSVWRLGLREPHQ